jgi:hypothetical protein
LTGLLTANAEAAEPKRPATVSSRALGTSVLIIGPLGVPLGRPMTVEGMVVGPSAEKGAPEQLFAVERVDGAKLSRPVRMRFSFFPWGGLKSLKTGERYVVRAYQHGAMTGVPHQVMRETVFVQTTDYAFSVSLVLWKKK